MSKITLVLIKSLIVNIVLTIVKITFGIICRSKVLIADGFHSLSDLATDIVAIFGSKISGKPADDNHPYGHGKAEYLTSIVIGSVILALAISLLGNSFSFKKTTPSKVVLYVTIFTIICKYLLANYILVKGKKYKSNLLIASGKESRSDVFSSLIVVVTYLLSLLNNYSDLFSYSDSIGSLVIGLIILRTSYNILKDNILSILGEVDTNEEYIAYLKDIIYKNDNVRDIFELHIIKYGHYNQANITIGIDEDVSIKEADEISNDIKKSLINDKTRISYVKISINPYKRK